MTARASSEQERQSAASAAREFRDSFEMSLGGPMFAATDDAQLERIAGWFERDFVTLLESRERPLLEQVAALREALDDHFPSPAEGLMGTDEDAAAQEAWAERRRTLLASTAEAAREHDQRVREEEREACAKVCETEAAANVADAERWSPTKGKFQGAHDEWQAWMNRQAQSLRCADLVRARSQTEGA